MDVEQLRKDCKTAKILHGPISAAGMTADALLRILDAFEVMQKRKLFLDYSEACKHWYVADGTTDGVVFTEGHDSPLAALLAATRKDA